MVSDPARKFDSVLSFVSLSQSFIGSLLPSFDHHHPISKSYLRFDLFFFSHNIIVHQTLKANNISPPPSQYPFPAIVFALHEESSWIKFVRKKKIHIVR